MKKLLGVLVVAVVFVFINKDVVFAEENCPDCQFSIKQTTLKLELLAELARSEVQAEQHRREVQAEIDAHSLVKEQPRRPEPETMKKSIADKKNKTDELKP